jgi:hypothetical protein
MHGLIKQLSFQFGGIELYQGEIPAAGHDHRYPLPLRKWLGSVPTIFCLTGTDTVKENFSGTILHGRGYVLERQYERLVERWLSLRLVWYRLLR